MTSPLTPISTIAPLSTSDAPAPPRATAAGGASFGATLRAVSAQDAVPPTPPAEVHRAIGVAQDAWNHLAASGRSVSFGLDPDGGPLRIALTGASGAATPITGSQALAIAGGESVA